MNPIRVIIEPARQRFGFPRRGQWKWSIVGRNGEPIDPRDTGFNTGDIRDTMRTLFASDVPVELEIRYRDGRVETEQLR